MTVPISLNLQEAAHRLAALQPDRVFNLVETLCGKGCLIHLAPSLWNAWASLSPGQAQRPCLSPPTSCWPKGIWPRQGCPPPLVRLKDRNPGEVTGPWLVKSVWEHASIGLDEDSIIPQADREKLVQEMERRSPSLGGCAFAEAYIDGREFNLSLLAAPEGPEVLPPAEIRFDAFPSGKPGWWAPRQVGRGIL